MTGKQTFEVLLEKDYKSEATGITIPFDVEKVFGAKRVPVKVRVGGAEHRSTIVRMGGKFMMIVPKRFREAAGVKGGEMITVTMEKDTAPRVVAVPEDFADALEKAGLQNVFSKISYTHQKEYVNAITEAKREETRMRRIENAVEKLTAKK